VGYLKADYFMVWF